jgi:hypothetical protein
MKRDRKYVAAAPATTPNQHRQHPAGEHAAHHLTGRSAEREPYADFGGASGHGVGKDP